MSQDSVTTRPRLFGCAGMYLGSTDVAHGTRWIADKSGGKLKTKEIAYIPALVKLFDEVLVNALDNRARDPTDTTEIRVNLVAERPQTRGELPQWRISVRNNGKGIPVVMHRAEHMYVPELVLGHLLTGSNFDDTQTATTTGGRHGYGAKLTNIFSTSFTVETLDTKHCKRYRQVRAGNDDDGDDEGGGQ